MKLQLSFSAEIEKKIPGLKLGLLQADSVTVQALSELAMQELEQQTNRIREKFQSSAPAEDPIVSSVRRMYRRIGWEPTRYRPSSEAMIRRILKGSELFKINNLVDLGNIASFRFHLPLGLYDSAKIMKTVTVDVGNADESYVGLSNPLIHAQGKLVLRDEEGIFGNPTADSKRTCISDSTVTICGIFFTPPEVSDQYLENTLDYLTELYQRECPDALIHSTIFASAT